MRIAFLLLLVAFLAVGFVGCRTEQAGSVKTEGFLSHPELLKKGEGDEALLYYMRPGVDFKKYPKVLIRPITIWAKGDSSLKDVSEKDRQMLVSLLQKSIHDEVGKVKTVVAEPGPGVMEIRGAILEAEGSTVVLDSITTLLPQALIISSVVKLTTGTKGFAGEAAVALEIRDSVSLEVLAAGVDRRHGGTDPTDVFSTWSDVDSAFKLWAKGIREKIQKHSK